MTDETNLPKRTTAQKIGETAADIFSSTFTEFCTVVPVPQSRDLGIDFKCEVMEGEYPTGLVFNAQCKARSGVDNKNSSFPIQVQVTTVNYWLIQRSPTFLFVYDPQQENFFWCFPKNYVLSLCKEWKTQRSISIPVLTSNSFSRDINEIPSDILKVIKDQDPSQKVSNLEENMDEIKREYEAELEYQTFGKYEEYEADIMMEEWKIERRNQD